MPTFIPSVNQKITEAGSQFRSAVSENLVQTIGGSVNYCLDHITNAAGGVTRLYAQQNFSLADIGPDWFLLDWTTGLGTPSQLIPNTFLVRLDDPHSDGFIYLEGMSSHPDNHSTLNGTHLAQTVIPIPMDYNPNPPLGSFPVYFFTTSIIKQTGDAWVALQVWKIEAI